MRPITSRLTQHAISATLLAASLTTTLHAQTPAVTALRCDALTEPLGIDDPTPRLAWQYRNPAPGAQQTAYRIQVFSTAPNQRHTGRRHVGHRPHRLPRL